MAFAELLATDLASVEDALAAGADRLELCAALEVGGVTPGIGFLRAAVRMAEERADAADVIALVRPRRGDFLLDGPRGLDLLRAEVEAARDAGAAGVAVGVLTETSEVDFASMEALVRSAGPMKVTFHRAIDHARDPLGAARRLPSVGVARLLTSGSAASALEGAEAVRELVATVGDELEVIAAGGVHGGNARQILDATGAPAIHGSCSRQVRSPEAAGGGDESVPVPMGSAQGVLPENIRSVLDGASARAFVAAAHSSFPSS